MDKRDCTTMDPHLPSSTYEAMKTKSYSFLFISLHNIYSRKLNNEYIFLVSNLSILILLRQKRKKSKSYVYSPDFDSSRYLMIFAGFPQNVFRPRYCIRNRTAIFLQKRHHFRKRLIIPLKWMFFFLADWFAGMQSSIFSLFLDLQSGFGH